MAINFHPASPILRVSNLDASIHYFESALGFTLDWKSENIFASITRMKCDIMLSVGDQGEGKAWIYIGVGDIDALYQEYKRSGARIRQQPTNFPWACEMQVEDLDGNIIRFGAETKKDMQFGPWLDMKGNLWPIAQVGT
jgi:predicted enzyme related to lactoylglutathione lyase